MSTLLRCSLCLPDPDEGLDRGPNAPGRYALLEEIDAVNKQLWLLQKTDDEDRAVRPRRLLSDEGAEQPSSRSSRREGLRTRSAPHSYTENDEGSAWIEMRPGGKVVKFVAARKKLLKRTFAVSDSRLALISSSGHLRSLPIPSPVGRSLHPGWHESQGRIRSSFEIHSAGSRGFTVG